MSEPTAEVPHPAASVILVRERPGSGEVEVFLVRRHSKASFMSRSFVFPGGMADPGETDPRITAARELFEEAGVLLADRELPGPLLRQWRDALNAGEQRLSELLAGSGAAIATGELRYYSHWITPSMNTQRFAATFYVAVLPAGQGPSPDNQEAVEEAWVTPAEALARAGELMLPPPQLRIFMEMRPDAERGLSALLEAVGERAKHPHPILPRGARLASGIALLLPWDPDYLSAGTGDSLTMPADHPLAVGPSRFVLEDKTWKHIAAPTSPNAG